MPVCSVCGNDCVMVGQICQCCGSVQDQITPVAVAPVELHRVINIKCGNPFVAEAMQRLELALRHAAGQGVRVLTIIHGYGSSGKGGIIRDECRQKLVYLRSHGHITQIIPGEECHRQSGPLRDLLRRFPRLAADRSLTRSNPGITLVVLK